MKVQIFACILGLVLCSSGFCETFTGPTNLTLKFYNDLTINGPAKLKLVKADSLEVNGPLEFSKLKVANAAVVHGPFKGDEGKFGTLEITGDIDVSHVVSGKLTATGAFKASYLIVNGPTELIGIVNINHGQLEGISITAEKATLDTVKAKNVVIHSTENEQTLILSGSTVIEGDIVFESGKGILEKVGSDVKVRGNVRGMKGT